MQSKVRDFLNSYKQEVVVGVIAGIVLLFLITIVSNPSSITNQKNDQIRISEIETIMSSINSYIRLNPTSGLTHSSGKPIPTVTLDSVVSDGIPAESIDHIDQEYISFIPQDPSGNSYKVGYISGAKLVIGIELSDGSIYTLSE